jgi:Anti-sigma-28 factor, FlgM
MVVALVTKGPLLYADGATLKPGMDDLDNPTPAGEQALNPIDEQRRKKIDLLKQAVADGTYDVSAEQLADKLIEHMLEPKG